MSVVPVEFARDDVRLSGRLELPDGEPSAFALFAHCFTCSKDYKAPVRTARALAARSVATLRFDFTGLGDSGGDFARSSFRTMMGDIGAAADFLAQRYRAPSVLIGHSMGGAAALAAADGLDSVRLVATVASPAEPGGGDTAVAALRRGAQKTGQRIVIAGRELWLAPDFFDYFAQRRLADHVRRLGRALVVFHPPDDDIVPVENARKLFSAARHPRSFVALDGADHLLSRPDDAEYVADIIAAWVRRYGG